LTPQNQWDPTWNIFNSKRPEYNPFLDTLDMMTSSPDDFTDHRGSWGGSDPWGGFEDQGDWY
jgi:hypothetical protein